MLEDDTSVSYMLLKNMFDGKEVKLINAKVKTVKLAGNEKLWYDHGSVILRQQSEITFRCIFFCNCMRLFLGGENAKLKVAYWCFIGITFLAR